MTQTTQNKHFDLHTSGFGFFNRVRKVKPAKGNPYWAVTVMACRGDEGQRTYFECSVVGTAAKALFDAHLSSTKKDDKITASFKLGDTYPETFVYGPGPNQGQIGVMIRARLLKITYLKVNDKVLVHSQQQAEPAPAKTPEQAA